MMEPARDRRDAAEGPGRRWGEQADAGVCEEGKERSDPATS